MPSQGEPSAANGAISDIRKENNTALWITYLNIVIYALCYQLQRPVEPFLVKQLSSGGSIPQVTQTYGQLQSFFSLIQTVGSSLMGIVLDRVGVRKASALVFAASAASYAILAVATNLPLLFLSKVPTAFQHAFLVAQAVAACQEADDAAARAQALGRMTTAYTVGATLGPALGGWLAEHGDLYVGAKLAVMGSLVSVVLSCIYLPDASVVEEKTSIVEQRSVWQELQRSLGIALRSTLWPLLLVKVVSGVASSMFHTALPMVLTQQLHFDPATLGLSMSSSMFATAVFGAFGMATATKLLGAVGMAQSGLIARPMLNFCLASLVATGSNKGSSQRQIILISVVQGLASHALATGLTTQTTGAVAPNEQGALLGLEHGLFSLARIGGPAAGTSILSSFGFWTVSNACSVIDVGLLLVLFGSASQFLKRQKDL